MEIRKKIRVNFTLIWLLFLIISGFTLYYLYTQRGLVQHLTQRHLVALNQVEDLLIQLHKTRRYEKEYFIYITEVAKKKKYTRLWIESIQKAQNMVKELIQDEQELFLPQERELFFRWEKAIQFYRSEAEKIIQKYIDVGLPHVKVPEGVNLTITANQAIKDGKNRLRPVFEQIKEIKQRQQRDLDIASARLEGQAQTVFFLMITLTVVSGIYLFLLMRLISEQIFFNLQFITEEVSAMNKGDFSADFNDTGIAELDQLLAELREAKSNLLSKRRRMRSSSLLDSAFPDSQIP